VSVGHLNLANAKLSSQKQKKFTQFFSKIAGLGSAHKIFQYKNLLSGANSHAVCVLKLSLLKQATAIKKLYFIDEITNFFSYCYRF